MTLITQTLIQRCSEVNSLQRDNPLVVAKFFNPCGGGTWLLTEYYPEDNIAFGYVHGLLPDGDEWGYFSIEELEALRCPPLGLPIERDEDFTECYFLELKERGFQ